MSFEDHRGWTEPKAIPEQRDRLQSRLLTWVVGALLAIPVAPVLGLALLTGNNAGGACRRAIALSVLFLLVVWLLRAATLPAALCGGAICLLLTLFHPGGGRGVDGILHSGLLPLLTLFLLTFAATRIARARGVRGEAAEVRRGRRASQVIANLGWAGLLVYLQLVHGVSLDTQGVLLAAVLAEATADTASSEIGQAYGGTPFLLGSWRRVGPGTDGAVTLVGTLAGVAGALLVVLVCCWAFQLSPCEAGIACVAGVAGLFFDTVLGASLERRGWLGNDLVNFASVGFAGLLAWTLLLAVSHR